MKLQTLLFLKELEMENMEILRQNTRQQNRKIQSDEMAQLIKEQNEGKEEK